MYRNRPKLFKLDWLKGKITNPTSPIPTVQFLKAIYVMDWHRLANQTQNVKKKFKLTCEL